MTQFSGRSLRALPYWSTKNIGCPYNFAMGTQFAATAFPQATS